MHELIEKRRSIRAFADKEISKDDMLPIIEAASWAPSSMNEQPWRYQYAYRGSEGFQTLWNCLVPSNQLWTDKAAVLMVCIAKKNFSRNGKANRHYMHDCGLANENLIIQAISMDIYAHPMGGFDMELTKKTFQLGDDDEPVCFIALGYKGDPSQLEEPNRTRETEQRTRKSIAEISTDIS
ncbi:MAG TPA: nitroreductase family protein [Ferruginibacter sp.]|nr:nitroreductase family protein [Ferruginibacter sp.]